MAIRTVALWRFDEPDAAFPPADVTGHVAPLLAVVAGQVPPVVAGTIGLARRFSTGFGFRASELVAGSTRLARSVTAQAILAYTQNGAEQTIIARGKRDGSAGERRLFSVSLVRAAGADYVRVAWDKSTGVAATIADIPIEPPPGKFVLSVVRSWVSASEVIVSAYGNGRLVGTTTSADGDIEDGHGGEITVGTLWTGAAYGNFYAGDMDEIKISDAPLSTSELEHDFRRMFLNPHEAYDLVKSSMPPGVAFSQEPQSLIQRLLQVASSGLSRAWSKARELADYFQPDVAFSMLDDWERIHRLPPTPGDSLETRRARLLAFMRRLHGYNTLPVLETAAPLLGLPIADLPVIGVSNIRAELFDGGALRTYWTQVPSAGVLLQSGGKLAIDSDIGDDARHDATTRAAVRVDTTVSASAGVEVIAQVTPRLAEDGAKCGIYFRNAVSDEWHLFGFKLVAGSPFLYHERINATGVTEVISAIAILDTDPWLRVTHRADGSFDFDYRTDATGFEDPTLTLPWLSAFAGVATFAAPKDWTGLYVSNDVNPAAAANGVDVLAWRMWCPAMLGVFQSYIYRDPTLPPTSYDRAGAQAELDRIKPAFGRVTIIESLSLVAGDLYSRAGVIAAGDTELPS